MPINKSKTINLLPDDDFQNTNFGRVVKWALSSFRVIVIVTELVVMSAFLSRFWLDARNSDLNAMINLSKAQVKAYSEVEKEFRLYQKQLSVARNLYSEDKNNLLIQRITTTMPDDIILNSIQRSADGVQIKAIAFSEQSIAQFLVNLENLDLLDDVRLSQVASSINNESSTTFMINAKVLGAKGGIN